jgi:hypothetical protein
MEQAKEELKVSVRRYRDIDNQIREINKTVYQLRENRKIIEMEVVDLLKTPYFAQHKILALEDGSKIKIQRPTEWTKPWSLSKKDLLHLLQSYFQGTNNPNASGCFNYILEQHQQDLTTNEFKLTRFVSDENVDNE